MTDPQTDPESPESPEVPEPDPLAPDSDGLLPPFSDSKYLKASRAADGCDTFAARVQAVCWALGATYSDDLRRRVALADAVNTGIRVDRNLTVNTDHVTDAALEQAVQALIPPEPEA